MTESLQMPKFDFSSCEITTDEQLDAELSKQNQRSKYFDPGKYDVTIDEVEYMGTTEKDPTWGKLSLTFKGAQERTIMGMILLPFNNIYYGAKKTTFPFKKFSNFCSALGVQVKRENLESTLKSTFGQPDKLKGLALSIEVGYEKGYIKYAGKNTEGGTTYCVHTNDGNKVCSAEGTPLLFPDRAAALNYAKDNGIAVDEYPRVLNFSQAASGSGLKTGDANW